MRINVTKNFDASGELQSDVGQKLRQFISYVTQGMEQLIRLVNGSLSFKDNFAGAVRTIEARHNVEQIIDLGGREVSGVLLLRVLASDSANSGFTGFSWWVNDGGKLVVKLAILGAPASTVSVKATLAILY